MRKPWKLSSHATPGVFIFVLIGAFALSVLTLTLLGARVYSRVSRDAAANSDAQLTLSYVANKVRAYDAQGCVRLEQRDGLPLLCLYETLEGERYQTAIYLWQGYLYERFALAGEPFEPEGGESLIAADALTLAALSPTLLEATIQTPEGASRSVRVALRAATLEVERP